MNSSCKQQIMAGYNNLKLLFQYTSGIEMHVYFSVFLWNNSISSTDRINGGIKMTPLMKKKAVWVDKKKIWLVIQCITVKGCWSKLGDSDCKTCLTGSTRNANTPKPSRIQEPEIPLTPYRPL